MNPTTSDTMPIVTPKELLGQLRSLAVRCRNGVILASPSWQAKASEIAARLWVDHVDYAKLVLGSLPPGAKRVGIGLDAEQRRLDGVAESPEGMNAALVSQFDIALARLTMAERGQMWRILREGMPHRRRVLLLLLPEGAAHLLPTGAEGDAWQEGHLLTRWADDESQKENAGLDGAGRETRTEGDT